MVSFSICYMDVACVEGFLTFLISCVERSVHDIGEREVGVWSFY